MSDTLIKKLGESHIRREKKGREWGGGGRVTYKKRIGDTALFFVQNSFNSTILHIEISDNLNKVDLHNFPEKLVCHANAVY